MTVSPTEAVGSPYFGAAGATGSTAATSSTDQVDKDPAFQTFLKIAQNPHSNTTPSSPNGGAYQLTLQNVGYAYESGKLNDLQGALRQAAAQIDNDIEQAQ